MSAKTDMNPPARVSVKFDFLGLAEPEAQHRGLAHYDTQFASSDVAQEIMLVHVLDSTGLELLVSTYGPEASEFDGKASRAREAIAGGHLLTTVGNLKLPTAGLDLYAAADDAFGGESLPRAWSAQDLLVDQETMRARALALPTVTLLVCSWNKSTVALMVYGDMPARIRLQVVASSSYGFDSNNLPDRNVRRPGNLWLSSSR